MPNPILVLSPEPDCALCEGQGVLTDSDSKLRTEDGTDLEVTYVCECVSSVDLWELLTDRIKDGTATRNLFDHLIHGDG